MGHFRPGQVGTRLKIVIGLVLVAAGLLLHFLFEVTRLWVLPPMGIVLFVIGFYLSLANVEFFRPFRSMLPFLITAILLMWAFLTVGWDSYIVDSSYGTTLADVTTGLAVNVLNGVGIHATRVGGIIFMPSTSKVQTIVVNARCAGVQTALIYSAAFALMLVDVGRKAPKKKLLACFAIGISAAYLANIFRVSLLALIGYAFGYGGLYTVHLYSGHLIFLGVITAFWWLSLKWLLGKPGTSQLPRMAM